jgi:hypothetical protein
MLQQLGQPLGVEHVALAAGEDLDVAGVHQLEPEGPLLEHIPDGLPIRAGGFHHHLGHSLGAEPVGHRLELTGERLERPGLLAATPATGPWGPHAGDHLVLADVDTGTPLQQHVHGLLLGPSGCGGGTGGANRSTTLKGVNETTVRGAGKAPGINLRRGFERTKRERAQPGPTRFSSLVAAPRPWNLRRNFP